VLVVLESLGRGGAERLVVTSLSHLDPRRFSPQVAILQDRADLAPELEAQGIPVHRMGLSGPGDLWAAAVRLRRLIRDQDIEVVHSHLFLANVAARLAVGRSVPLITTLHNPDYTYEDSGTLRFRARKALDRLTLAWARPRVLAVSEEVRADYARHFGLEGVEVLHNYMDVAGFREELAGTDREASRRALGVERHESMILHVGRFHRQKAQDQLLEAFAAALNESPHLKLFLVGDGALLGAARAQAEELRLADSVVFLGSVADPVPLYGAADLFAFPSRFEAFGIALLEAMAAGLPSVVTRVGGITEVATDETSLFVGVDEPLALARALVRLAEDPDLRSRLGRGALERARTFDVHALLPRLEALYEAT
jgi:glycosyltransferase involved in cell wall biosynthesis